MDEDLLDNADVNERVNNVDGRFQVDDSTVIEEMVNKDYGARIEDAMKNFGSLDQYKQHRESNSFKPASLQQAKRFLAEKEQQESVSSTNRAYMLAKQAEQARKMQKAFDSHFLRIKN